MKGAIIAVGTILFVFGMLILFSKKELVVREVRVPAGPVFLGTGAILVIIGMLLPS